MKYIEVIIGGLFMLVNILLGMILTAYSTVNVCLNCGVIVFTTILLFGLRFININEGFKISFRILFPLMGIIEYILCLFSPHTIKDNWFVVLYLILISIKIITILLSKIVTKK